MAAAGGHGDYAGNEVVSIHIASENPTWRMRRMPSEFTGPTTNPAYVDDPAYQETGDMINSSDVYLDGTKASSHTYWTTQFLEEEQRVVMCLSGGMNSGSLPEVPAGYPGAYPREDGARLILFDLATNRWLPRDLLAPFPSGGGATSQMCCSDPTTGNMFVSRGSAGGRDVWKWDRGADRWSRLATGTLVGAASAVDPSRRRMLVVSGRGRRPVAVLDTETGERIAPSFGGLGTSALDALTAENRYPGVMYDDANDAFLVFANTGGAIGMLRVDAATFEVSQPTLGGEAPAERANGMLNAVQYLPALGGFVTTTQHDEDMLFMRTSA